MSSLGVQVQTITSPSNVRVKAAASLARRRERLARGLFLAEGPNAVAEVLADGLVEEVFCVPDQAQRWSTAPRLTVVDDRVLRHLADSVTPQGVVAVVRRKTAALDDVVGRGVLVVLCGVADPGNVGTIIRAADAFGATAVVVTEGSVDPFNPKAVRAAAGSTTHLPLVVDVTAQATIAACRAAGQRTVALDGRATATVADAGVLRSPVALVFGSEAHGVGDDVAKAVDQLAAVPMAGRAESLNLAAAAAIALYEAGGRRTHEEAP